MSRRRKIRSRPGKPGRRRLLDIDDKQRELWEKIAPEEEEFEEMWESELSPISPLSLGSLAVFKSVFSIAMEVEEFQSDVNSPGGFQLFDSTRSNVSNIESPGKRRIAEAPSKKSISSKYSAHSNISRNKESIYTVGRERLPVASEYIFFDFDSLKEVTNPAVEQPDDKKTIPKLSKLSKKSFGKEIVMEKPKKKLSVGIKVKRRVKLKYFSDEKNLFSSFNKHKPCLKCAKLVSDPLAWTACVGNSYENPLILNASFTTRIYTVLFKWQRRQGFVEVSRGKVKLQDESSGGLIFSLSDVGDILEGETQRNEVKIIVYMMTVSKFKKKGKIKFVRETISVQFKTPGERNKFVEKLFIEVEKTLEVLSVQIPLVSDVAAPKHKHHIECLIRKKITMLRIIGNMYRGELVDTCDELIQFLKNRDEEKEATAMEEFKAKVSEDKNFEQEDFKDIKTKFFT
eukprot:augustus_masked-scaffold_29-processed-gene-4.7-mRNA-1 protein AED:1.00 eAED:1.00 QI:0/-1/0/0/-1/1/1/0/456